MAGKKMCRKMSDGFLSFGGKTGCVDESAEVEAQQKPHCRKWPRGALGAAESKGNAEIAPGYWPVTDTKIAG
jgi:hypothetical protein